MSDSSLDKKSEQYQTVDDNSFSTKELKWSFWFVKNRLALKRAGIIALIFLDAVLVVFPVYGFVNYFWFKNSRDQAAVAAVGQQLGKSSVARQEAATAKPLLVDLATVFDNGNGTYDFVASVENPNPNWYALITFNFAVTGASSTASRTMYVLPGEKKFLDILGEKRDDAPVAAEVNVINEKWSRLNAHDYPEVAGFLKERQNFTISDGVFSPAGGSDADVSANQITFLLRNDSAYNFWSVPVQVALWRGGSLVGLEEVPVDQLKTGELRRIDLRNYVKGLLVDEVQVLPSVDVFDPAVYMNQ